MDTTTTVKNYSEYKMDKTQIAAWCLYQIY